jgi:hypothetical protein
LSLSPPLLSLSPPPKKERKKKLAEIEAVSKVGPSFIWA